MPAAQRARVSQPEPRPVHDGSAGGAGSTMRSVSRLAGVPVFQSEELIIERLVKPDYPPLLLAREVEGKVTVQALVDTVGQVVDVQVLASTGETQFEAGRSGRRAAVPVPPVSTRRRTQRGVRRLPLLLQDLLISRKSATLPTTHGNAG